MLSKRQWTDYCSLKSYYENWKEALVKDFYELSFYSVLQALNLKSIFEQTEVYHFVHYIADFENEIIAYTFEKSVFYNCFINMNHAESE